MTEDIVPQQEGVLFLSDEQSELISNVHNTEEGHFGVERTWKKLNESFPGHNLSVQDIFEYISMCTTCLKNRQKYSTDQLTPIYRPLPKLHSMLLRNFL